MSVNPKAWESLPVQPIRDLAWEGESFADQT
jgi:hypothetical protein